MNEYEAATYGDRIANVYDDWYERLDPEAAVEFLAQFAESGPVLELGIGSGRVAIPLLERGVEVWGIDASKEMVARLRSKPQGAGVPVTIGNFADVNVDGKFSLIFVVFNTFFKLPTQDDQVRCFQKIAGRLDEGGAFVIEAFVPDLNHFDRGQRVDCDKIEQNRVMLTASRHDPVRQCVDSQHLVVTEEGVKLYPICIRYAWPAELNLMAQLAGMKLRERWGGWRKEPSTSSSTAHVSVYEHAG